jgi:hypothetical protein
MQRRAMFRGVSHSDVTQTVRRQPFPSRLGHPTECATSERRTMDERSKCDSAVQRLLQRTHFYKTNLNTSLGHHHHSPPRAYLFLLSGGQGLRSNPRCRSRAYRPCSCRWSAESCRIREVVKKMRSKISVLRYGSRQHYGPPGLVTAFTRKVISDICDFFAKSLRTRLFMLTQWESMLMQPSQD